MFIVVASNGVVYILYSDAHAGLIQESGLQADGQEETTLEASEKKHAVWSSLGLATRAAMRKTLSTYNANV